MAEGRDRTPILVAILGLAGVLGAAVIANWEKIHSTNNPAETQTPQRATLAPNASFPTSAGGMQQDDRINDLAFDPSENLLASASDDRTIVLWDTSNQQKIRTLAGHIGAVTCIAFSLDGRWLASGSMDRTIRLWEVSTGRMIHTLNDSKVVSSVALSPDGHWLASTGDESVKIWDTTRPRVVHVMAHDDFVDALAFNPDGKLLASGSIDKTVRSGRCRRAVF